MHPARELGRARASTPPTLYEEARQTRLGTEKFMLDGRHTGTGGGNHIVARRRHAGRQPAAAPARSAAQPGRLLAQPSVAVVPVLGPVHRPDQPGTRASTRRATTRSTSWRSRSAQIPEQRRRRRRGWSTALFRNLLVDVTGNTHRAEFCIDKLYSPDSGSGRLGLRRAARLRDAAARAHEPGAAAAAARAGRAVLGRRRTDARWCAGAPSCTTASCCRTSSRRISRDVIDDLRRRRLPVRAGVVRAAPRVPLPAHRRRSPAAASSSSCATRSSRGTCSARKRGAGGTVRYVDSSVERLQVKVDRPDRRAPRRRLQRPRGAAASDRHATASTSPACATAPGSRRSACIRRSPVHAPLVFDSSTPGTSRSIGGCTYHVAHPGGRSYDTLPGQRLRGRGPAAGALLRASATRPGRCSRAAPSAQPGVPVHAGPAPALMRTTAVRSDRACDDRAVRRPAHDAPVERLRRLRARRPASSTRCSSAPRRAAPALRGRSSRCARGARAGTSWRRRWEQRAAHHPRERRHLQRLRRSAAACDRPWELDIVPLRRRRRRSGAGSSAAWRSARALLNLILADLYGPQRLLRDGLLPPALVLRQPGLPAPVPRHAACRATCYLHLHAADLARAAGRRAGGCSPTARRRRRAPATRSRTGSCCRAACPRRSATATCSGWRRSSAPCARRSTRWRRGRRDDAAHRAADARARYNETYFEHAYLARYLGFTLVEGGDLTVRDERVYLKTLDGSQPVDVDPAPPRRRLLRSAGAARRLVARRRRPGAGGARRQRRRRQRARQRRARDAGAAAVPARPLPAPARRGAAAAVGRHLVVRPADAAATTSLEHLDELVIKPAFPVDGREPVFGARAVAARARRRCSHAIRARPARVRRARSRSRSRPRRCGTGTRLRAAATWCCAPSSPPPATTIAVMPGGLDARRRRRASRRSSRCSAAAAARTPGSLSDGPGERR